MEDKYKPGFLVELPPPTPGFHEWNLQNGSITEAIVQRTRVIERKPRTTKSRWNLIAEHVVAIRKHVYRNSTGWKKDYYDYELSEQGLRSELLDLIAGAVVWVQAINEDIRVRADDS